MTGQSHSGEGDNVGGNKILNINVPRILILSFILISSIYAFIYWRNSEERFFFDKEKIDVVVNLIDSLQIRGLNEYEKMIYDPQEVIYYDMSVKNDTIYIEPSSSYLSKLKNNEEIGDEFNLYCLVPSINFKVTNNSNKTIYFSKAVLNVETSIVDPLPIPVFHYFECYDGFLSNSFFNTFNLPLPNWDDSLESGFVSSVLPISIYNEGWGSMYNVNLDFNISGFSEEKTDLNLSLPFKMNFEEIQSESFFDLFPFLREQGVDVDRIIELSKTTQKYYRDSLLNKYGLGKYDIDDLYNLHVHGNINYIDVNGKKYKNNFSVEINALRSWGCGGYGIENGSYNILLCPEGTNYEIVHPISNYLKSSDVDNFSVLLNSPKSSIHKIRIRLYYSEDEYIEKFVKYNLIVPRRMIEDKVVEFVGNSICVGV